MKRPKLSLENYRNRLANLEALPQFALLGILSGVIAGIVILVFRLAIELPLRIWLPDNDPENFESLSLAARFIAPCLGAILIGIIFSSISKRDRSIGVPHVMERLNLHQGYLPLNNAGTQFLVGVISLISGGSAGREGPAIHLGATFNSLIARRFHLPNNSIRVLVGCGTAGAIAASFNTPIAGVIFAMEVVMIEYTIAGFTPVILAAVSATVISRIAYGDDTAFSVPALAINSLWELPFVVLLGILLGALASLFIKVIALCARFNRHNFLLRATVAGVISGLIAMLVPSVMGIGYDSVAQALQGGLGFWLLATLALAKLAATALCVGLGLPFGLIGPVVVIGASAGAALGVLANLLLQNFASDVGIYSMLGMGAMMGAVLQAPLAALMALLELTGNPNIILPGMLVIVVASITARAVFKQASVFQVILEAQGVYLQETPVVQALRRVGVVSLMNQNFVRQEHKTTLQQASELLDSNPDWIVICKERQPVALLPAADLARYLENPDLPAGNKLKQEPESPASGIEVNLLAIPAKRKDLKPIYRQATLQEALDALQKAKVEALYVERVQAPMMSTVMGILTKEDIENYYLRK